MAMTRRQIESFTDEEITAASAVLPEPEPMDEREDGNIMNAANTTTISHHNALTQIISFSFTCDLCHGNFTDQFSFFEHLKSHYDQQVTQPTPVSPLKVATKANPKRKVKDTRVTNKETKSADPLQSTGPHSCFKCGRSFVRQKNLKTHLQNVHGPETETIDKGTTIILEHAGTRSRLTRGSALLFHDESESALGNEGNEDLVKTESANLSEYSEGDISYIISNDTEKDTVVEDDSSSGTQFTTCGDIFESTQPLLEHTGNEHGEEEPVEESDGKSKKATNSRSGTDTLKCSVCDRVFNHRNSLVYHMKSHTGERPHTCEFCGKSFFATSALKVHSRLHSGEKPYSCEYCGRSFRQYGDMTYHIVSIHSDIRQYQCEFCGKDFARKYSLVVHRRIHTGERNYKCEFCDKCFRAASYLQNHRRIHTGEKPHNCTICGKPFRVRSDMKRHLTSHTREKPTPAVNPNENNETCTSKATSTNSTKPRTLTATAPAKKSSAIVTRSAASSPPKTKHPPSTNVSNPSPTAVNVQSIVAVNEAGEIVTLEPELARQLQEGQIIQVPVSGNGSITLTQDSLRRINIQESGSIVISGDIDHEQQVSTLQVEDAVTEIKDEIIYHDDAQPITISEGNICDTGTLYVWNIL